MDAYLQSGLDALADSTRFAIFERLMRRPMAVQELANTLPVSRPAVSQHLRVLSDARLITAQQAGTRRVYRVNPEGIALLREHFDKLWEQALTSFVAVAEAELAEGAGKPKKKKKPRLSRKKSARRSKSSK